VTDETAPRDGIVVTDPVWQPWRPDEAARRLAGVAAAWYVAGGRALDLHRSEHPGHAWIGSL
jgi:hypothetical protein